MNGQAYDRTYFGFQERLFLFVGDCITNYRETGDRKYINKILLIDRWLKEEEREWNEEYR